MQYVNEDIATSDRGVDPLDSSLDPCAIVTRADGMLKVTWSGVDPYAVPTMLRHAAEQAETAIMGTK